MALINNLPIFIETEDWNDAVESTSHPVEKGVPLTDHTKVLPLSVSLKGKIVDYGGLSAKSIFDKIKELQTSGSLITYIGRRTGNNLQIQSFPQTYTHQNWGGCDVTITLKEVRIANPAHLLPFRIAIGTQKVDKGENNKVYHTVKKGDCCWNLVTKQYKNLVFYDDGEPIPNQTTMEKCNEIMAQNPHAFSRKGDFRTLQIGKKIFVGFRK